MMKKSKRLLRLFDGAYALIQASFKFWWGLLAGGLVYGWLPALRKTLAFLGQLPEETPNAKHTLPFEKVISFLFTLSVACGVAGFYGQHVRANAFFLILYVVGLTLGSLLVPFSVFYLYGWAEAPRQQPLELIYQAQLDLFKRPALTLFVLALLLLAGLAFYLNKIVFVFGIPGVALALIGRAFSKVMKIKVGEAHD